MTEQVSDNKPQVAWFMRFLVTSIYIVITVFLFIGVAYGLTSEGCPSQGRCSKMDNVIFALVGLGDFILGFGLLFFGMKGKLPGTRQLKL